MHRGRQLPPLTKSRDETSSLLKELRSELQELERAQKAVEDDKSAQMVTAKTAKKTKSVLAKRLLEQHRMLAMQRHHDEAVEHAARVHDFNDAMREQAQAHIHRIVMQREFVRNTLPSPTAIYAEHANMELPTTGALLNKEAKAASVDKLRATTVSIKKEMGSMKTLLHDLVSATQRGSSKAADRSNGGITSVALLSAQSVPAFSVADHDPIFSAVANSYRPPDIDVAVLQAKAQERLERLEEAERRRRRDTELRTAGIVGVDEAIVDGKVVRENAEMNQKGVRLGVQPLDRSANSQSGRVRILEVATQDESRELQIIAQHEKQQQALTEQRGYLRRLRERLALLETDDARTARDAEKPEERQATGSAMGHQSAAAVHPPPQPSSQVTKAESATAPQEAKNEATTTLAEDEPSVPVRTQPATEVADAAASDEKVAAVASIPPPTRAKRSRVLELRALCAELERDGEEAALADAQARLLLALHRDIADAQSITIDQNAVATVVAAFVRAQQSKYWRAARFRYLTDATVILQNAMRIPGAKERLRLRRNMLRRIQQWYPAATMRVVACVVLQCWFRGHITRKPKRGPRFTTRLASYRASLVTTLRREAAILIQTQYRRHVAAKQGLTLKAQWRQYLVNEQQRSDAIFQQEAQEGIWC